MPDAAKSKRGRDTARAARQDQAIGLVALRGRKPRAGVPHMTQIRVPTPARGPEDGLCGGHSRQLRSSWTEPQRRPVHGNHRIIHAIVATVAARALSHETVAPTNQYSIYIDLLGSQGRRRYSAQGASPHGSRLDNLASLTIPVSYRRNRCGRHSGERRVGPNSGASNSIGNLVRQGSGSLGELTEVGAGTLVPAPLTENTAELAFSAFNGFFFCGLLLGVKNASSLRTNTCAARRLSPLRSLSTRPRASI